MAKNQDLAVLQRILERAITLQNGKIMAIVYREVQDKLGEGRQRHKDVSCHLRQIKRKAKGALSSMIVGFKNLLVTLEKLIEEMDQILSVDVIGVKDLESTQCLLQDARSCLRKLQLKRLLAPDYEEFLKDIIDPRLSVESLRQKEEAIDYQELLWEEKRAQQLVCNDFPPEVPASPLPLKEKRKIENRERARQHPRGKGRRGRRHHPNDPYRP